VSNRQLKLWPVLASVARDLALASLQRLDLDDEGDRLGRDTSPSLWVALARDESTLGPLRAAGWGALPPSDARVWTDDYSNILSAIRWH
jgi:hypothetical protein